ncbi:MAG: hypothetical protein A3C07_00580 [Candidatus Sungbacteria bacterium RIFCSPHIGHO2_02_FULL_47_11]|uniref:Uncharacterized protein n=1 Tax=Candidatus Sungbacteria bacterium RIFCSPHIGHO2_02_FULL_47_11 TaxID=1802270 RepID=A0A1G2KHE4_9BACT|nr:MAG: hypothetical protein A3C07_00580 [Candidatus Sungbacteria bacterium RIFCSPHIGHO2_02_FULL_47_11]
MSFGGFIKDLLGGPNAAFQKLVTPGFFSSERAKLFTLDEYAKWLRKQYAYYGSMAYVQKEKGLSIPQQWIDGLRMIEDEIEKVKKQGASHFFSPNDKKMSDELQTR